MPAITLLEKMKPLTDDPDRKLFSTKMSHYINLCCRWAQPNYCMLYMSVSAAIQSGTRHCANRSRAFKSLNFNGLHSYQFAIRSRSSDAGKTNDANKIRVRFAPSPTGSLHIGGLRTALYNYLFACKQRLLGREASFIIRVEDTDSTRTVAGSAERMERLLAWAGIKCDESPSVGGDYGPYVQSKRVVLYSDYAKELIARQAAYYCFCSPTRVDLLRKEALRNGRVPGYDNKCRHLDPCDSRRRVEGGDEKACVRLRFDTALSVNDIVFGTVENAASSEGDPVLLKQDGMPTYHFANVIDDHLMEITHVLRGAEWLASTPKHLLLYRAFGWAPPKFAHLPLLLDIQGRKLSKRLHQDVVSVDAYVERGVYPEALLSFLCSSGAGFSSRTDVADNNTGVIKSFDLSRQLYLATMQELIDHFELGLVHANPCRLAPLERVLELNHLALAQRFKSDRAVVMTEFQRLLRKNHVAPGGAGDINIDEDLAQRILEWGINVRRVHTLKELLDENIIDAARVNTISDSATRQLPNEAKIASDDIRFLSGVTQVLEAHETNDDIDVAIKALKKHIASVDIPQRKAWYLIRFAIIEKVEGAPVAELIKILGVKAVKNRIRFYCANNNAQSFAEESSNPLRVT